MNIETTWHFQDELKLLGINPYVSLPTSILQAILEEANVVKGKIPVLVTVNGEGPFPQTLLIYQGAWRLYINQTMLKQCTKRIGESLDITLKRDTQDRILPIHPSFQKALTRDVEAMAVYHRLIPSLQHEINRYLYALKGEESMAINIEKALDFLKGKGRFVGRSEVKLKKQP